MNIGVILVVLISVVYLTACQSLHKQTNKFDESDHVNSKVICDPSSDTDSGYGTGTHAGHFYSWYELSSADITNCDVNLTLLSNEYRRFKTTWNMPATWSEDAVGGLGWEQGSSTRRLSYQVNELTSNSQNQRVIVGLYGWSCEEDTSQEYYVIDTWFGDQAFVPWDETIAGPANKVTSIQTQHGIYDIYVLNRNGAQYCGNGEPRSFQQYWSVKQIPTDLANKHIINFSEHLDHWQQTDLGFNTDGLESGYQIFVAEIFGDANVNHKGSVDISVWE